MITGGEDALYIARRLAVVASEDVGLADNHALPLVSVACSRAAKEWLTGRQWPRIRLVRLSAFPNAASIWLCVHSVVEVYRG